MGIGGISIWQLLIILAIVIMLFGTKRLRTLGSDLGSAVKGFRKSIKDDDGPPDSVDTEVEDVAQTPRDSSGKP
ncbi:twin-arginine translocase TatA/TatE family subunit [Kineobactrum salinum]|uniref:Sec-independent protein translocase protein TatA n=1 Tax=Kineobactrum salinum TaxID=2708301 RepID=A0A6C0U1X3_9GAMM|nr:twin-arginine translocase TatA/TatE family subunit [Kineobactrum salinum]QIB64365.1 twin-arginine translocase TatA/TatE family subunit [Kineobactrum salinum]